MNLFSVRISISSEKKIEYVLKKDQISEKRFHHCVSDLFFVLFLDRTSRKKQDLFLMATTPIFSFCFITIRNLLASMPKSASNMWPTRWKSVGYKNQNLNEGILTINRFQHNTPNMDRFSERVVDKDIEDVAIKERDPLPPIFVSQNFHHSGVGKSCLKFQIHFNTDTKLA